MIDLFDGIDNDALLLDDCNGNPAPHHWLGDGYCDEACFNAKCNWDKRDCLKGTQRPCADDCMPTLLGDRECDEECDNEACGFDGGDCTGICAPGCQQSWLGDQVCDDECNTATCRWDGGDCLKGGRPTARARCAWATGVYGPRFRGSRLVMQDDGNLVQYTHDGQAMWCTRTSPSALAVTTSVGVSVFSPSGAAGSVSAMILAVALVGFDEYVVTLSLCAYIRIVSFKKSG